MTLPDFVTDVVDTNPLVREQVHSYRQVIQDHEIALSGWRPSLDLTGSVGQFNRSRPSLGAADDDFNSSQLDLTLTQNLFNGFDTTNQVKQARARISSAAYRLFDTADNVALDAIRAYIDVLQERRLVELAAQNVESHERILSQIRELSDRGITRRSDVEQTEGRLAQAQASYIAQQNNLEDALTRLHRLLGRYLKAGDLVEPDVPTLPAEVLEKLIDDALVAHPAIESAQYNIQAAKFDYKRSRRSDYPTLDLQLQGSVGEDVDGIQGSTEEGSVMLNLRYNLFRGGADRAEQRKKISVIHENKAFLDRVRRQVIDALRLAWTADQALQKQLPYLERHAAKSLETLDLYRQEFLLQSRDLIDVLDAESELNRALIEKAEAHYAALAARYRVYEGMGELFDVLNLGVDVSEDDLRISRIQAAGVDPVEPPRDLDSDGRVDDRDQCDNTLRGDSVGRYGCRDQPGLILGYTGLIELLQAVDDVVTVEAGKSVVMTPKELFVNDSAADEDRPRLRSVSQPRHGLVRLDFDGNVTYRPEPGFSGEDEFTYTISDRRGRESTASVHVVVRPAKTAEPPDMLRVHFDYKKLTLTADTEDVVDQVVERLEREPELRVEIYAYTDAIASPAYNLRLARHRADTLRRMLIQAGIEDERIDTFPMGETDFIADNATEAGRALNRRGEFVFVKPLEN